MHTGDMPDDLALPIQARQPEIAITVERALPCPALAGTCRDKKHPAIMDDLFARPAGHVEIVRVGVSTVMPMREHPYPRRRLVDALANECLAHAKMQRELLGQYSKARITASPVQTAG